jgi:hypothetical protein
MALNFMNKDVIAVAQDEKSAGFTEGETKQILLNAPKK